MGGLSNKMSSVKSSDVWLGISAPAPSQIDGEVAEKDQVLPEISALAFPTYNSTGMLHPFNPCPRVDPA